MSEQPVVVDVSYTVKELFEKVDRKLDLISEQLTGKADRADVTAVEKRIEALEQFKWKLVGLVVGAGMTGAGGVVGLLKAFDQL